MDKERKLEQPVACDVIALQRCLKENNQDADKVLHRTNTTKTGVTDIVG